MTQPVNQPMVQNLNNAYGGPPKEEAMVGVNHALLNAFHQLYLGKKKAIPPGLESKLQGMHPAHQGPPPNVAAPPVEPQQPPPLLLPQHQTPAPNNPQMQSILSSVRGFSRPNFRQQVAQRLMQLR